MSSVSFFLVPVLHIYVPVSLSPSPWALPSSPSCSISFTHLSYDTRVLICTGKIPSSSVCPFVSFPSLYDLVFVFGLLDACGLGLCGGGLGWGHLGHWGGLW
ncbi:hypothetical protein IWZ00DRAFT_140025 [Phyllosticta capitalensis]